MCTQSTAIRRRRQARVSRKYVARPLKRAKVQGFQPQSRNNGLNIRNKG